ncbi:unnamed protein product, partial [marine sediment metagenome]
GLSAHKDNATATTVRLGLNNIAPGSYGSETVGGSTGEVFFFDYDPDGGMGDDETYLAAGDSGGPSFTIVDGQPALVGIHWFTWDGGPGIYGSGDTFVSEYVNQLNTAMAGESVTSVIPEPATLLMLLSLGITWLVWHRWRRARPSGHP